MMKMDTEWGVIPAKLSLKERATAGLAKVGNAANQ
jgi:hypothetical protein